MKKFIPIIFIGFASGLAGSYTFGLFRESEPIIIQASTPENKVFASYKSQESINMNGDFVAASAQSTPSVVFIQTVGTGSYQNHSWFDWFFNGNSQISSSGSGVIFSDNGYIITNNHVIEKADKIEVIHERRTYQAKVIGTDPSTDLAILKVEAEGLPAVKIGNSKNLQIGEWVLAVGNPFNLTSTVTAGIVSAKARNINVVNSQFPLESFIQTDAAINPGNSGGALVNSKGELVGINTAILSKTGSYTGYGFAVPVDIVVKVVKDLIKYGCVQKAFIGAEVSEVNTSVAEKHHLKDLSGVIVTYLQKDGAAEKIGLKKGDIILKLNDIPVNTRSEFEELLAYHNPGDKIKITFKTDSKLTDQAVTLTNREGTTAMLVKQVTTSQNLGASFETVSKVERDKLNIANGVKISGIKNGLIARMGLPEGFIITSINKVAINSPEELIEILEKIKGRVMIEGLSSNGGRSYYNFYF
ncbi:MAG: trypsin-like peptidase domain-containing protein [Sporocytophaga sp.]|nr:trypsin-like peptidase domain-containing protein [Sporocytophaga sp.]